MTEAASKAYYQSPIGTIEITERGEKIVALDFTDEDRPTSATELSGVIKICIQQLDEYFKKHRKHFDFPMSFEGTEFQVKVWNALMEIDWGKTVSYADLSIQLGDIKAIRAVASANGKNPLPIVAPCHRVIGSDGSLTGYSGGLWRKKWLLEFESPTKQGNLFE